MIIAIPVFLFPLLLIFFKRRKLFYFLLCLFLFFLGFYRYSAETVLRDDDISRYAEKNEREVLLYGTVISDPEKKISRYGEREKFLLAVSRLRNGGEEFPVTGKAQVNLVSEDRRPEIGDEIVIGGILSLPLSARNPAGFDHRGYLETKGVTAVLFCGKHAHYLTTGVTRSKGLILRRYLFQLRRKGACVIKRYLEGPPEAVTEGVVLGIRGNIPDDINDSFMETGTMHILAVSGLHVGIVGALIVWLLRMLRCPMRAVYCAAIVGIFLYAILTGESPSSMRSAFMGAFVLAGLAMGRKSDVVNALSLSAFLITFFDPVQIFQAGFILSYTAVLSMIYLVPVTDRLLKVPVIDRSKGMVPFLYGIFLKSISISAAVWIGMMPIIAGYFRIITPSVVFANLIAVPVFSLLLGLGLFIVTAGALPFLGGLVGLAAICQKYLILTLTNVLKGMALVPFSHIMVPAPGIIIFVLYYGVLFGIVYLSGRFKWHYRLLIPFLFFTANLFVWNEAARMPEQNIKITFFDVRQGDAALVEFPDGAVALIDGGGGGPGAAFDAGESVVTPYLWQKGIRYINCVLLTHAHEDHIGGLFHIVKEFNVGMVLDAGNKEYKGQEKALYKGFLDHVSKKNIKHRVVSRGDIIEGLRGMKAYVLNPWAGGSHGDPNNDSVVVKLITDNGDSVLFCGDAGSEAMDDMLRFGALLESDVLKVPHHGGNIGDPVTADIFFEKVKCKYAVISRKRGHFQNKWVRKKLEEMRTKIFDTSVSGAIVIRL